MDYLKEKTMIKYDFVIVGGGPAGLSAAILAAEAGVRCLLIDENKILGGQLYKQIHKFFGSSAHYAGMRGFEIAKYLSGKVEDSGLDVLLQTRVFGIWDKHIITAVQETEDKKTITIEAKYILLATGAVEKNLVFKGNTLPGVISAGAAQTMMNIYQVKPGKRALVVGAGNVGVILAYQMVLAGIDVVGIVEAGPKAGAYEVHLRKLKRMGIPFYTGHVVKAAIGRECVEAAEIIQIDKNFHEIAGTEKTLDVDLICISAGMMPRNQLSRTCGCRQVYERGFGGMLPVHNEEMESSIKGILVAGDLAGVEEASTAMDEGRMAALNVLHQLGKIDTIEYERMKKETEESLACLRTGTFGEKRMLQKQEIWKNYQNIKCEGK